MTFHQALVKPSAVCFITSFGQQDFDQDYITHSPVYRTVSSCASPLVVLHNSDRA